jgi:hypothetical protein
MSQRPAKYQKSVVETPQATDPLHHRVELLEQFRIARLGRGDDGVLQRAVGADRAGFVLAQKNRSERASNRATVAD